VLKELLLWDLVPHGLQVVREVSAAGSEGRMSGSKQEGTHALRGERRKQVYRDEKFINCRIMYSLFGGASSTTLGRMPVHSKRETAAHVVVWLCFGED